MNRKKEDKKRKQKEEKEKEEEEKMSKTDKGKEEEKKDLTSQMILYGRILLCFIFKSNTYHNLAFILQFRSHLDNSLPILKFQWYPSYDFYFQINL